MSGMAAKISKRISAIARINGSGGSGRNQHIVAASDGSAISTAAVENEKQQQRQQASIT